MSRQAPTTLFRPALVLALVLVSIFSLSAFMALSAFAPDLRNKSNGGAHAWSRSAVGFAGFVRVLQETGHEVLRSRTEAYSGRADHGFSILTPVIDQEADLIWGASEGPALVVLPKWQTSPDPANPQWVVGHGLLGHKKVRELAEQLIEQMQEGDEIHFALQIERTISSKKPETIPKVKTSPPGKTKRRNGKTGDASEPRAQDKETARKLKQATRDDERLEFSHATFDPVLDWQVDARFGDAPFALGKIQNLQTMRFAAMVPLIWSGQRVLLAKLPDQELYILSDPDLMNTTGLADFANLAAGVRIVDGLNQANQPTLFDMTLHGFKNNINLLKTMLMPPFLAASLCALATAGLMAWAAWFRFGPVSRPQAAHALGKQALVENSAALIRLAGRASAMAPGYLALSRKLAARAIGAPRDLTQEQLTALLVRIGKNTQIQTDLAAVSQKAEQEHFSPNELLDITSKIYQWRGDISGEHRNR